jgi:hypothetical protein
MTDFAPANKPTTAPAVEAQQSSTDPFAGAAVPNMRATYVDGKGAASITTSSAPTQTVAGQIAETVAWGLNGWGSLIETSTAGAGAIVKFQGEVLGSAYRGVGHAVGDNVVGNAIASFGAVPETAGAFIGDTWAGFGKGFSNLYARLPASALTGKLDEKIMAEFAAPFTGAETKKPPE